LVICVVQVVEVIEEHLSSLKVVVFSVVGFIFSEKVALKLVLCRGTLPLRSVANKL
jgi:hypothetical protein